MFKYKSILLLKLPFCTHPDALKAGENFRTKAPFRPVPSLGMAALAAFFQKYKHPDYKLKVFDVNIEAYTTPGVPIDISVYPDLLEDIIKSNDYDVLALSTMFVFNVRWVDTAVALSRKLKPNAKIILGGGYPTLFPQLCLQRHDIDDVVIGEGEDTFVHIINKYNSYTDETFEKKFPFYGYAAKNEKGEIITKKRTGFISLEDVPIPAWEMLNVDRYFERSGDGLLPIEGSRGCPYSCTYCCTDLSWGKKVRYKTVDQLIDEMIETGKRHKVKVLHFNDDNLGLRKKWLMEFLQRTIDTKFDFRFSASNFSVKHLDEEVIDLLRKAYGPGQFIGIAVETGSPMMQKQIKKNLDFDEIREVVRLMKSRQLHVHIHWMVGFPNETIEQIQQTFAFARELRGHSNQFLTVTPYPGTELFNEAKAADLLRIPEYDFDNYDNRRSEYLKSDHWDYPMLQEMIYDANIEINFLNHPQLDEPEEREEFLVYLTELLKRLPDHIISRILVGYIYKQKGDTEKSDEYYHSAYERFGTEKLNNTFYKYLSWEYPSIKDFNRYLEANQLDIEASA